MECHLPLEVESQARQHSELLQPPADRMAYWRQLTSHKKAHVRLGHFVSLYSSALVDVLNVNTIESKCPSLQTFIVVATLGLLETADCTS